MITQSDAVVRSVRRRASVGPRRVQPVVVAVVTIVLLVGRGSALGAGEAGSGQPGHPDAAVRDRRVHRRPKAAAESDRLDHARAAPIFELSADAGMYSVYVYHLGHTNLPLGRLAVALTQLWVALIVLLPLPIMLFPDGRIESRAWRWALWVYVGSALSMVISTAFPMLGVHRPRTSRLTPRRSDCATTERWP